MGIGDADFSRRRGGVVDMLWGYHRFYQYLSIYLVNSQCTWKIINFLDRNLPGGRILFFFLSWLGVELHD